jgi:exodeoxyribonuclease VII small subunit
LQTAALPARSENPRVIIKIINPEQNHHMNDTPNYTEAFEELQLIVSEIESGDIHVDQLSEKVKRAALLITICKNKLSATEGDVNRILQELESKE